MLEAGHRVRQQKPREVGVKLEVETRKDEEGRQKLLKRQ